MKPTARMLSRAQVVTDEAHVIVSFDDGTPTRHLAHETYRVWAASDGKCTVDDIADALDLTSREVFDALDVLADFGLIDARQAPPTNALANTLPAGMNRREALARIALGVAGGAAALSLGARSALAQDATKAADSKATTSTTKAAAADDAALKEEISALDKRIKERHAKRKKALDCRAKITDTRAQESATKREACGNPGQLNAEIKRDERALAKKRRQEQKRKTTSHQEEHYKMKAR